MELLYSIKKIYQRNELWFWIVRNISMEWVETQNNKEHFFLFQHLHFWWIFSLIRVLKQTLARVFFKQQRHWNGEKHKNLVNPSTLVVSFVSLTNLPLSSKSWWSVLILSVRTSSAGVFWAFSTSHRATLKNKREILRIRHINCSFCCWNVVSLTQILLLNSFQYKWIPSVKKPFLVLSSISGLIMHGKSFILQQILCKGTFKSSSVLMKNLQITIPAKLIEHFQDCIDL